MPHKCKDKTVSIALNGYLTQFSGATKNRRCFMSQSGKEKGSILPAWFLPGPRKKRTAAERRKRKAKRKQTRLSRRRNRKI